MAGAPKGNNNAGKGSQWREAISYALENYEGVEKGQALRKVAAKVVGMALEGDMQAIKEIGDRLDGKPVQAISGEGGGPLTVEIIRFASTDSK